MSIITVGSDLVVLSAVLAVAGPILYAVLPGTRRTWWRDSMGQHLMSYMAVIGLTMALSAVAILLHVDRRDDWFAWVRLGAFSLVPIVLAWRDIIIFVGGSRRRDEEDTSGSVDVGPRTPESDPSSVGSGSVPVREGQ